MSSSSILSSFDIASSIDISTNPFSARASFPYSATPCAKFISQHENDSFGNMKVNQLVNCSSSDKGVCYVQKTLVLSNSHAGTHADQPKHFLENPTLKFYDESKYKGHCYGI